MTSSQAGFHAKVLVSSDGGTIFNEIGELREVELSVDGEQIDVSNHDVIPWREFIDGRLTWTATAESLYLTGNTAQDDVFDALVNQTGLKFKIRPKIEVGQKSFDGDGVISDWSFSGPNDDAAALGIEIQGTGPLVRNTQ